MIELNLAKGAVFSPDRRYRYALWRVWSPSRTSLTVIGLNPSTANEVSNDPTITRMMSRAARDGFGALLMGNLYAFVSTDPDALLGSTDSVGPENDAYLKEMIALSSHTLCAWGSFAPVTYRATAVLKMIPDPWCLGVNHDGQPRHPLYLGYHVPMVRYVPRRDGLEVLTP